MKPRSWQRSSIAALVTTAPIGTPAAERLREHEEVRHDAVALEAVHRPEPAEPGLALVEDHEHAALGAQVDEPREVARRRHDHAARRQHGLGHHRGRRPDRGLVEEIEARLQAGAVALAVAGPHRAAVGVRGGQRERARQRRPVAAPAGGQGQGGGAARQPVPAARERGDLEPAGAELGHPHRDLDRLAAGGQEHRPLERRRNRRQQRAGQVEHRRREHPRVEVDHALERALDRRHHARVVVADGGADLAGREVEHAAAAGRLEP